MAKGNDVLKIAGILLILFGILGILFAMMFGFVGAMNFDEMGKSILTGLLIFYGLLGILTGFFQIGVGATAIRHSNIAGHWLRCIVWGVVMLVIGICCTVVLFVCTGMIHKNSEFYPPWFCFAIVIIGCIVLPLLMIFGGILNKLHVNQALASADAAEKVSAVSPEPEETDVMEQPAEEEAEQDMEEQIEKTVKESPVTAAFEAASELTLPAKSGGRLEFMKNKRLSRQVDPRVLRKFGM